MMKMIITPTSSINCIFSRNTLKNFILSLSSNISAEHSLNTLPLHFQNQNMKNQGLYMVI
ncbi:hypothetical protein HanXRQr2_Chr10g0426771 [Helianthus annuus]|uniref:Uncharacterized protein n=1 Tax=Helianthus annuus TaxID=4232 RepID=A0A251TJR7_HELAN|nr:hypothetical protein HanXRQr2_Chr10g0426771 [Helianthus annuus]